MLEQEIVNSIENSKFSETRLVNSMPFEGNPKYNE